MSVVTVVVIGGAGAIGREIAAVLAERGDAVVIADLVGASAVAGSLPGSGHSAVECDVTDLGSMDRLLGVDSADYDAVVYAAGTNYTGFVGGTDWSAYERLMQVNLRGAFYAGAAIARRLESAPRTLPTVFLASTAGLRGEAGGSVYCATKFGLIGFVQSFAAEIAQNGGRANAVAPGNIDSPMLRGLAAEVAEREGSDPDEKLRRWADTSAFQRLISTREVAEACAMLLSPASSGISGQTLVVDGPPAV